MKTRRLTPRARELALLCCVPLLGACTGLTIHDESRAQLAAQGKKAYADAKVTEVGEEEQKNLAFMLGEEIKAVRASTLLQSDFTALAIANNEGPMSDTHDEARSELQALGFASIGDARDFTGNGILAARARDTLRTMAKVINAKGGGVQAPSDCESMPPQDPPIEDPGAKTAYERSRNACEKVAAAMLSPKGGRLGTAFTDWKRAKDDLSRQEDDKKAKLKAAREAASAYRKAVQDNAAPMEAVAKANADLIAKEKTLADALGKVQELKLAGSFDDSITALVDLLSAAAEGKMENKHPELAEAAVVLKVLPALRTAVASFQAANNAIPVSGLLLELQRQTLLADGTAKRLQLQEERVALLLARSEAYKAEVQRWLRVSDALCSYAVLGAKLPHPGGKCDKFELTIDASTGARNCALDGNPLSSCLLVQSWKDRLRAGGNSAEQKRELYKAAGSYLQAIAGQSLPRELALREIDVRHRETLLARRNAIDAWNGLVSVPLDQLNAYYASGIKPAELADLIVKALGLTAIAVGAAQ